MKSFAICALFAAGVSAVPMAAPMHAHLHRKRDIVWVTETDVDIVTDIVTQTVWVGGSSSTQKPYSAPAYTSASSVASSSAASASSSAAATSSSASVVPVQSSSSSSSSSSSVYVAPTTTSTSAYVAPTTTTTPAYVAPTTTTTSAYTPPTTTAAYTTTSSAAPTSYSAAPTGGAGGSYVGALSYYEVGLGSCGNTNTDSEDVVAMDEDMMDKATMCGKMISITANGVTVPAQVVDTCPGCRGNAGLDLSPSLFAKFAPTASGIVPSATWSFM